MKYIKMATSFNFGEVVSVIIASIVLPFLPETPIQLLVEGLLYDFGQMTIPFDNVDKELIRKPKKLNIKSLKSFMFFPNLSIIFPSYKYFAVNFNISSWLVSDVLTIPATLPLLITSILSVTPSSSGISDEIIIIPLSFSARFIIN